MSWLGIALTSAFASNALLSYGFGTCSQGRRAERSSLVALVALSSANLVASALVWSLRTLVLGPLGLGALEAMLYALVAAPLVKYLARAAAGKEERPGRLRFASLADEAAVSCLVFGIALVSSRSGYGLGEALLATAFSTIGYWAALVLLEAIRERLELSDLPPSFAGPPALLVSAGLMAMAFMGIDAAFVSRLAG